MEILNHRLGRSDYLEEMRQVDGAENIIVQ
jgi:hypothetical protein